MTIKSFFSAQEQKQILALRDAGCSLKKISAEMRRSRPNITMFLNNPEEYKKLKDLASGKSGRKKSAAREMVKNGKPKKMLPKTPTKTKDQSKFSKTAMSAAKFSSNGAKITGRDLAEFNKVILEHRCVIKFYTKLGERPSFIYASMKKAYSPLHPPLPAVQYWAAQFRKGRQTILNEPGMVRKLKMVNSKKVPSNKKSKANSLKKKVIKKTAKAKSVSKTVANGVKPEDAEETSSKEEEPPKKIVAKKLPESTKPFTIKLPGMDRLSKTLL